MHHPFDKGLHGSLEEGSVSWFAGGKLNMCYNAIDRHVLREGGANDLAMIWEGDEPTDVQHFTYGDVLHKGELFFYFNMTQDAIYPQQCLYIYCQNSLTDRQCAEGAGREKGRRGDNLHAHDSRAALHHACMRQNRRCALRCICRILSRGSRTARRCFFL
mmetsp:Transcript_29007/g.43783  ORF Transcript_29007/g.43783 Transcript_29007/m.43783 type:complete len:160 (+) Transcript_29007:1001-1480(+)